MWSAIKFGLKCYHFSAGLGDSAMPGMTPVTQNREVLTQIRLLHISKMLKQ